MSGGNAFALLAGGPAFYGALRAAIAGARREVLLQSYLWANDATGRSFLDAAAAAARRGVAVKVILDGVGGYGVRAQATRRLGAAGGEIGVYNPVRLPPAHRRWYRRNHRKLAVVDGAAAFIGGFGFWDAWSERPPRGRWDVGARVRGPVVAQFRSTFAHDWRRCGMPPLPDPDEPAPARAGAERLRLLPSLAGRHRLLVALRRALHGARDRALVCTTYFIPNVLLRRALRGAARRGVDVRLLLPAPRHEAIAFRYAGRRHYGTLLAAGVRIFEYLPAFLHAKYAAVDGRRGYLGSSNLDNWSGRINMEADLELCSPGPVRSLEARFAADARAAREISLGRWMQRPVWLRAMERVTGWVDPLL